MITLAYIAVTHGKATPGFAARFVASYLTHPPGEDCRLIIVCNGGPLSTELSLLLSQLSPEFYPRHNDPGWDITAFIDCARTVAKDSELLVCLGESVYFHRAGWLTRLAAEYRRHGPGGYGVFSSYNVRPHLQTTAFACPPRLLATWPRPPKSRWGRYEFEHGQRSFWRWLVMQRLPSWLVTWDGCWGAADWRTPANILWRGDQSNLLMLNHHTDRWAAADAATRREWTRNADGKK